MTNVKGPSHVVPRASTSADRAPAAPPHASRVRPRATPLARTIPALPRVASRIVSRTCTVPISAARVALPAGQRNPDFDPAPAEIAADFDRMKADPLPLERPLVVLSGYRSWPTIAQMLRLTLGPLTQGPSAPIFSTAYTFHQDIDACVATALRRIERVFPSPFDDRTIELDVIGISMGGLVARRAATPHDRCTSRGEISPRRRLNVRRMFTLGTPHRGALLAEKIAPDPAANDMKPGSAFLQQLDEEFRAVQERGDYDLTCYAVLNDRWVGATRASPPGMTPHWTRGAWVMSHFTVSENPAIIADLARRLRGEAPLSRRPSEPPSV